LFTTGIKDVIWGMPNWVPDKSIVIDYFIKAGKKNLQLCTTENVPGLDELQFRQPKAATTKRKFCRLQTGNLTKKGLRTMVEMIKKNGNEYILDIDLDYFVCNGMPLKPSYWKDSYDLESFKRTKLIDYNQHIPRSKFDQTRELINYEKKLRIEVISVVKRVKKFIKLIAYLKKHGLRPSHISICDSTNVLFSECTGCNSLTNGYVPSNLALLVHHHIISGLTRVNL